MREKLRAFRESLTETTIMTKREFVLITAVCILGGIVFGMLFSPKKNVMIGSKNGNNNCNNSGDDKKQRIDREKEEGNSDRRKHG